MWVENHNDLYVSVLRNDVQGVYATINWHNGRVQISRQGGKHRFIVCTLDDYEKADGMNMVQWVESVVENTM